MTNQTQFFNNFTTQLGGQAKAKAKALACTFKPFYFGFTHSANGRYPLRRLGPLAY